MPVLEALDVILTPDTDSQAIIRLGPAGYIAGQDEDAPDLGCGACETVLSRGLQRAQYQGTLILECGQCSALNLVSGDVIGG